MGAYRRHQYNSKAYEEFLKKQLDSYKSQAEQAQLKVEHQKEAYTKLKADIQTQYEHLGKQFAEKSEEIQHLKGINEQFQVWYENLFTTIPTDMEEQRQLKHKADEEKRAMEHMSKQ